MDLLKNHNIYYCNKDLKTEDREKMNHLLTQFKNLMIDICLNQYSDEKNSEIIDLISDFYKENIDLRKNIIYCLNQYIELYFYELSFHLKEINLNPLFSFLYDLSCECMNETFDEEGNNIEIPNEKQKAHLDFFICTYDKNNQFPRLKNLKDQSEKYFKKNNQKI